MTRFMGEYTGRYGEYWKNNAMEEIKKMRERFFSGEIIVEDCGAVKWASSGHYLPEDCVEMLSLALTESDDPSFSVEATTIKRDEQDRAFIESYCKARQNHVLSDEERYEMECAFGKGATVVDVFTGQRFAL